MKWNEPRRDARKSWSILGIKLKEYFDDPGFWGMDPELRSQEELRVAYEALTTNVSLSKHRTSVEKTIRALPEEARESIEGLVEDRQQASSNEKFRRQWSVIAVRPKIKHHYGGEGFFKSAKSHDWLIMLKGETVDRTERKRPNRWDDPWRKPYQPRPRRRRYPRVSPRVIEEDYYERDFRRRQAHSPIRCEFPIPIIEDHRHRQITYDAQSDGFRPGTIIVNQVSNMEEAEKKMDEILEDLPNKFTV